LRRSLAVVLSAGLLMTLAVGWFAPGLISWYYTPPVELGVSCKPAVEWGIALYRRLLLLGAGTGFVLGAISTLFFKPKISANVKA
jgi:hypothetical protein